MRCLPSLTFYLSGFCFDYTWQQQENPQICANIYPETVKMTNRKYMSSKQEKLGYLFAIYKCLENILLFLQL